MKAYIHPTLLTRPKIPLKFLKKESNDTSRSFQSMARHPAPLHPLIRVPLQKKLHMGCLLRYPGWPGALLLCLQTRKVRPPHPLRCRDTPDRILARPETLQGEPHYLTKPASHAVFAVGCSPGNLRHLSSFLPPSSSISYFQSLLVRSST